MKAVVKGIQVGGYRNCRSLEEAACEYIKCINLWHHNVIVPRTKIHFDIKLPNGEVKHITIRDEDEETVAYGDFEGLPSALDYAKEIKIDK